MNILRISGGVKPEQNEEPTLYKLAKSYSVFMQTYRPYGFVDTETNLDWYVVRIIREIQEFGVEFIETVVRGIKQQPLDAEEHKQTWQLLELIELYKDETQKSESVGGTLK